MGDLNLAIIYYSSTGTIHRMAEAAAEAAREAGADVRLRIVQELAPPEAIARNPNWKKFRDEHPDLPVATLEDLEWADAILFGSPTRYGNVAAQMKQFLDQSGPLWAQGKLANKAVSAFASASNPHGGQETTILALYNTMHHWGAIIVPPGYTDPTIFAAGGNPYGTSAAANETGPAKEVLDAVRYQAKRLVEVARWLKAGREAAQRVPVGRA
ncbi:MAG: NAD(P)H:quinone oxidoreductase [Firmicutes bacterium]|nr:NAD(P)H:quinone oxidoreductase [Bacillota bacterium]MBE3590598.1 NAD(P)H:quinone oxidoreductase [Bacillota bacterium]